MLVIILMMDLLEEVNLTKKNILYGKHPGGITYKQFIKERSIKASHRCIIKSILDHGYEVKFETHTYPYIYHYMSKIESLVEWKKGELISLKIIDILCNNGRVKRISFSLKQNHEGCLTGKMKETIKSRMV